MQNELNRRAFLSRSAAVLGANLLPIDGFGASRNLNLPAEQAAGPLQEFAKAYMRMMHAPGMTVALLSGEKTSAQVFGFSDAGVKLPVSEEQPFWIGSICKSFVGIVAMQLRDEGKLDLHKPVLEIMPDLPFTSTFGPITAHHLLTHTSGLPNWLQLFSSDPSQRAKQAYTPGNRFAYCNLGYDTLGLLIAHLDGRSWPEAVTARILMPLGMTDASGQLDDAVQARMPTGYHFQYRGVGPSGRIVSEEGFQLFTKPYVKAPVLGPNTSYGYGIGVETTDGRTMLRYTGGTTAFASSILVDLDGGVGAFASINAMQGYRPNPVTKFAVGLLYSQKSGHALPAQSAILDPLECKNPEQFAGAYKSSEGELLNVKVNDAGLVVTSSNGATRLRPLGPNIFSAAEDSIFSGTASGHGPSEFALFFGDSSGVEPTD